MDGLRDPSGTAVLQRLDSGRRIGDYYAGLVGDFRRTQQWKRLRRTKHDHHPVHDALGNAEALVRLFDGER